MTIGSPGTFDYVAIVSDSLEHSTSSWAAQLRKPLEHDNDPALGCRLVGSSPNLQITDAGPPPNPSRWLPPVPRSRLTLTASSREFSSCAAASFYVDKRLTSLLQSGDALHLSRTCCGGLGVSAIRDGELVFAAGAITAVPLGNRVEVQGPDDLIREAEAVFKRRDKEFEFHERPIEVNFEGQRRIMYHGHQRLGHYEVWMAHGRRLGLPGEDECMAILAVGVCHTSAARASMLILDGRAIELVEW